MPETALPIKRSRLRRLTKAAVRTVALLLVLCALLIYAASWWASWKYSGSSFRFDTPSGPVTVLLGDLSVSPLQGLQATDVTVSAPEIGRAHV